MEWVDNMKKNGTHKKTFTQYTISQCFEKCANLKTSIKNNVNVFLFQRYTPVLLNHYSVMMIGERTQLQNRASEYKEFVFKERIKKWALIVTPHSLKFFSAFNPFSK